MDQMEVSHRRPEQEPEGHEEPKAPAPSARLSAFLVPALPSPSILLLSSHPRLVLSLIQVQG